ncbi:hypothetical protein BD309DRAFT_955750 [Dichomitus squalens]|nr:hypothetical protein BD309DRAFT_955750 [Dichomitus squalens]
MLIILNRRSLGRFMVYISIIIFCLIQLSQHLYHSCMKNSEPTPISECLDSKTHEGRRGMCT